METTSAAMVALARRDFKRRPRWEELAFSAYVSIVKGKSAKDLVRGYVREAKSLERRGHGGPEQLPSGAVIMKLDDEGRARVIVEAYRALPPPPRSRAYGECIMLGLLATTLLRKDLPLSTEDLETMTACCARAVYPAWGPCDYDHALLKALARAPRISPKIKRSLRALISRRGDEYAVDRRICAACVELMDR